MLNRQIPNLKGTRVIEVFDGEWIAQFQSGWGSWIRVGHETFRTRREADAYLYEQALTWAD